ncbi:acetyl-CoA carboxylase biotin carboxyl carrier protein subunit [Dyadobacter arcticus]|uniref:Acetyl/propionyl-CoA carboxylase alpha subunit n=1 Tax=Dyadobacter arcticus TaxID=1078754 RepID=A0ABX0UKM7_9BACT|nr:acetyl-CoA carboxylase biotin carboxyl carrier protein subunit [Dyadobacter arcticus]NIJ53566.1 acetyl/propionyl-CoA carboxylase alpha subunit [Dyadobacter arcticus]
MLKVSVSNSGSSEHSDASFTRTIDIKQEKNDWFIDDQPFNGDIARLSDTRFHIIWNNKSYNVEVLEQNIAEKTIHLLINGVHYYTTAKDRLNLLLEGMGLQNNAADKVNNVKAPMPGLIQSVAVAEGDQINKGDKLLVLVAMKMENIIKSSGNGVIKSLKVAPGEIVEKNQVLLEFQ